MVVTATATTRLGGDLLQHGVRVTMVEGKESYGTGAARFYPYILLGSDAARIYHRQMVGNTQDTNHCSGPKGLIACLRYA